uniref:class B sortase n=1 Tax=Catenibacterium mitsuokai TaxID=100886 RepID=UPI003FEF8F51
MKIIRRILLVVCLAVFLYSAGNLLNIGYKYHKLDSDNNKLQEKVVTEVKQDSPLDRKIDFNQLKSINEDIIGWIYIPNTNIDYALLKGKTNDTYIHTNYEKKYSFGGSIFLDEGNNASLTDSNTIIYGHNMKNGAMFANIKKFADHDYFINHPKVYIYLPDGSINVYSVYSTKIIDARSDYYLKDIDYASYVANAKSSAKQSRDVDTQNGAPLLLLSTCYAPDTTTRSVLFARLEKNVK